MEPAQLAIATRTDNTDYLSNKGAIEQRSKGGKGAKDYSAYLGDSVHVSLDLGDQKLCDLGFPSHYGYV